MWKRSILSAQHAVWDICDMNKDMGWIPYDTEYFYGGFWPPFHADCRCYQQVSNTAPDSWSP
jgi:hypothetical protein